MQTWYSVKGIFRWYFKDTGETANFEERVVLFRAGSFEEALALATDEARVYCTEDKSANFKIESLGHFRAYLIDEKPTQGVEVFSRLMDSKLSAPSFLKRYYPSSHEQQV
jgi:hypothetical protein